MKIHNLYKASKKGWFKGRKKRRPKIKDVIGDSGKTKSLPNKNSNCHPTQPDVGHPPPSPESQESNGSVLPNSSNNPICQGSKNKEEGPPWLEKAAYKHRKETFRYYILILSF